MGLSSWVWGLSLLVPKGAHGERPFRWTRDLNRYVGEPRYVGIYTEEEDETDVWNPLVWTTELIEISDNHSYLPNVVSHNVIKKSFRLLVFLLPPCGIFFSIHKGHHDVKKYIVPSAHVCMYTKTWVNDAIITAAETLKK